jgi:hypothetical protein
VDSEVSDFQATDAIRRNSRLLAGIAGPTGSGKTYSGLRMATGLADGGAIVVIDTERGRSLDYADTFRFKHIDFDEPFTPQRYIEALDAAEAYNPVVVLLDSGSHEHAGVGGVLDMQEAELQRMAGDDYKKREAMKFASWVVPKEADKKYVSRLTRMNCHLIIGLRAEEKIDLVKNPETGKLEVKPKRTLAGHVGWIPVSGKTLPYELTLSLVVTPDAPGVPHPIKLPEPLKAFVPLDQPISEDTGARLGGWARGGSGAVSAAAVAPAPDVISQADRERLVDLARERGIEDTTMRAYIRAEGVESSKQLTVEQYERVIAKLEAKAAVA